MTRAAARKARDPASVDQGSIDEPCPRHPNAEKLAKNFKASYQKRKTAKNIAVHLPRPFLLSFPTNSDPVVQGVQICTSESCPRLTKAERSLRRLRLASRNQTTVNGFDRCYTPSPRYVDPVIEPLPREDLEEEGEEEEEEEMDEAIKESNYEYPSREDIDGDEGAR